MSHNIKRLFIAIPIDEEVRNHLAKISEHRSHWPVRWVPQENLHLTLIFLGNRDNTAINTIKEVINKIAETEFFRVRLSYFEIFPSKKRPKLVWVKTRNCLELERLFDHLYLALKKENPDLVAFCKTYLPHVTLGRFKDRPHPAFTYTPSLPCDETITFVADRIALYESQLGGQHSTYKEIFSAYLK